MPIAEARIPTKRASRYLVQLCRHADQMRRMRYQPPARPRVDQVGYSDTVGTVRFADGQVTMQATMDALTLRVEAADDDSLRRLQDGIAARLQTIGRRDHLTTTWQRLEAAGQTTEPDTSKRQRRRRIALIGMAIGGALIVALHVGFGGAALAAMPWIGPVANTLWVIILAALAFIAVHFILGRFTFHGAKAVHARWKSRHEERS
jgi:hypothetical protein